MDERGTPEEEWGAEVYPGKGALFTFWDDEAEKDGFWANPRSVTEAAYPETFNFDVMYGWFIEWTRKRDWFGGYKADVRQKYVRSFEDPPP